MYLIIRVNQDGDSYIPFNSLHKATERFEALRADDHTDSSIFLVSCSDGDEFGFDQNNAIYGGAEVLDVEHFNI
jgi:hypothetical protein